MPSTPRHNISIQTLKWKSERNRKSASRLRSALLEWLIQLRQCSALYDLPIHLRAFGATSVRLLCVYTCIYLCCFEGCQRVYGIDFGSGGAVRYERSRLNPSALRNMSCHRGTAPSSSAGHMYYRSAGVMTRLAFVLVRLYRYIFFPPTLCYLFPINPTYWALLLRLKYWSLLRLTLSWRSGLPLPNPLAKINK